MTDVHGSVPLRLVLRLMLPFSAAYFLSYLYRTVNAVLAPAIARDITLDAAAIGLMTGAYFIGFGAFQLPLGLLLDRLGPRRVEAALLVIGAAGALAFAQADGVSALVIGRALVGMGVSACLMAPLKSNVQWFPPQRLPLMNGIVLFAGGLGAVTAAGPIQTALSITDWRGVCTGLAALTLVVAVILWRVVPDRPIVTTVGSTLFTQLRDVARVVRSPLFVRVAPAFMLNLGGFMAVQGLWAGPWLRDVAGLSPDAAARVLTVMAAAMAIGYLLAGVIAERFGRFGIPPARVSGFGMVAFVVCGASMAAGWTTNPEFLAAAYGFFGSAATINYAVLTREYPATLAGRVNTSANLVIFVSAFGLQWAIGWLIGLWPKTTVGGWPPEAYVVALGLPVVLQSLGLVWFIPATRKK